jgi:uncharacterized membrane protein YozB (DUF420 family)
MRIDKLQRYGAWFAMASAALLLLAIVDVAIVALAGGFANVANFGPTPVWAGPPMILATAMFVLSVLTGAVVAVDLAWIHRQTRKAMVYAALAAAVLATAALVLLMAASSVLGANGLGIASFVIVGGYGTYLLLINLAGLGAGTLGPALPWLGIASGLLFVIAAVFSFSAWAAVFPAVALYLLWCGWLGFRIRRRPPAEAALQYEAGYR